MSVSSLGGSDSNPRTQAKSPFRIDNDALLRLERMRVQEALVARDVAVSRLADACASVKEKSQALSSLEGENTELRNQLKTSTLTGVKGGEDKENVSSDPTDCLDAAIQTVEEKLAELRVSEENGLLDIENRPRVRCYDPCFNDIIRSDALLADGQSQSGIGRHTDCEAFERQRPRFGSTQGCHQREHPHDVIEPPRDHL